MIDRKPLITTTIGVTAIALAYWTFTGEDDSAETLLADEPAAGGAPPDPTPAGTSDLPLEAERPVAGGEAVPEIATASPSYRNLSFVVAIHDAGYVCGDIASARQLDDVGRSWRVECLRALAYYVSVGDSGAFQVTPTLPAFDSVAPTVERNFRDSPDRFDTPRPVPTPDE